MTMANQTQTLTGPQRHSGTDSWRMVRRKIVTLISGLAITWPIACYAQQQSVPPKRVGFLAVSECPISPNWATTRRLAELGWVEGQNFDFECVSTVGRLGQLPALARELVSRRPDVLIAIPSNLVRALQQETTTIPIVMLASADPVRNGLVTNLGRPEGNVTGVAFFGADVTPKRFEFLKEIVPHLTRYALVASEYLDSRAAQTTDESIATAASRFGFTWQRFRAAVANDYDGIFSRIAKEQFDAAGIQPDPLTQQNETHIIELALLHRIPTVGTSPQWARGGLLLSYGQDFSWSAARAADYVDKILRGAKPSDLPVEQATKLLLTINLKTAKALSLTVPPSLIARADEVIE
jgi:putative tryptophan/tyrosine transport system substrate-binding protein